MPGFLFPWFEYGSVPDAVVVVSITTPPQWGAVSASVQNWIGDQGPSRLTRLERIHDQTPVFFSEQIEFAHRLKSQFPWLIGTGNQIHLRSTLTQVR